MANLKMEERQLATAFSDLVLCLASLYSILLSKEDRGYYSFIGFSIFATASGLGCIRFSVLFPGLQQSVLKLHLYTSFLGSVSGLPMLAASYCRQTEYGELSILFVILSLIAPATRAFGILQGGFIRDVASTLSVLSILTFSLLLNRFGINRSGCSGALLFIFGGVVIGTDGRGFLGVANVDWFHYVLAGAVLALAIGIK